MPRIDPLVWDLRIMGIDTPKHKPVPQAPQHLTHLSAEEPRPWVEEPGRLANPNSGVPSIEFLFHGLDMLDKRDVARDREGSCMEWFPSSFLLRTRSCSVSSRPATCEPAMKKVAVASFAFNISMISSVYSDGASSRNGFGGCVNLSEHIRPAPLEIAD